MQITNQMSANAAVQRVDYAGDTADQTQEKQTPKPDGMVDSNPQEPYGEQTLEYDRNGVTSADASASALLQNILQGIDAQKELQMIPQNEKIGNEIYAISICGGKVHVQGSDGYEEKARAYEKLLNASLGYQFQWNWKGRAVKEETVLDQLAKIMDDYMEFDNEIWENDHADSIVNHVDEAFERWYTANKPQMHRFLFQA